MCPQASSGPGALESMSHTKGRLCIYAISCLCVARNYCIDCILPAFCQWQHGMLCCAVLCWLLSHCLTGCVASSIDADSSTVTQLRIPSSIKRIHSQVACIRWVRNRRPVFYASIKSPSPCCCDTSHADATASAAMSAELLAEHCSSCLFCVSFV